MVEYVGDIKVTISVAGMSDVVRGLEQGIETLRGTQSSLRATMDRFDLDTSQVMKIGNSVNWAVDELPGVRRRLAMAQVLEGSEPSWAAGTVMLDESKVSTVDAGVAVRSGKESAAALLDGGGKPDDALLAALEGNMGDPYFASGFASGLSPSELADVVARLSSKRAPADGRLDAGDLAKSNAWYGKMLTEVSTTMGTATRATGDLALPSGYAQSWVKELTAEVNSDARTPDGTGRVGHANALGAVLGSGGNFSTAFLGTVSEGVYDYERSFKQDHLGAVWESRSGDPSTKLVVADATGQIFHDPMAGIMTALGKDPAAAQNFFSGGDTTTVKIDGKNQVVNDRMKYLLQDRSWAADLSNGGSLSSALEAATMTVRNQNGDGRVSAEIAAQTFALIGEKTGEDWKMPEGMRPGIANMLSSYSTDLHRIFDNNKKLEDLGDGAAILVDGPEFPQGMPYGARMNRELMERIIGTLGLDDKNLSIVLAGVTAANGLSMSTGLAEGMKNQTDINPGQAVLAGTSIPEVDNSVRKSGMLLGWVATHAYAGAEDDANTKKKHQETIAAVFNAASLLPFIPTLKPEMLQWALNQARLQAVTQIKNGVPGDTQERFTSVDGKAPAGCNDQVMNLLLAAGYFGPKTYQRAVGTAKYTPPPAEAIIKGGPPRFRLGSTAYESWLADLGPNVFLDSRVTVPYDAMWPHVQ